MIRTISHAHSSHRTSTTTAPTRDDIRRRAAEIRSSWSETERARRRQMSIRLERAWQEALAGE